MIRANCRSSFQPADLDFLAASLPSLSNPSRFDSQMLDEMLDCPEVFKALLERHDCLEVSPHFYFYVLARHVLVEAGLKDRELADYVASMLTEFSQQRLLARVESSGEEKFNYVFELLQALQSASGPRVFFIRAHVGNASLFLTGIFPEHIAHRAERRGAPSLGYFENVGGANYLTASEHQLARELHLENVLGCLGERFQSVRHALNQLSDRLISIDPSSSGINSLLLKWDDSSA